MSRFLSLLSAKTIILFLLGSFFLYLMYTSITISTEGFWGFGGPNYEDKYHDEEKSFNAEAGKYNTEKDELGAETMNFGTEKDELDAETKNFGTEKDELAVETNQFDIKIDELGAETKKFGTERDELAAETKQFDEEVATNNALKHKIQEQVQKIVSGLEHNLKIQDDLNDQRKRNKKLIAALKAKDVELDAIETYMKQLQKISYEHGTNKEVHGSVTFPKQVLNE